MHLGSLIARLQKSDDAAVAIETLGDIVLFAEVQNTGARFDEPPGVYAAGAVARFASAARDEEWVTLLGRMDRTDDPAGAALAHMVRWALARDADPDHGACGCGSHGEQP